MADQSATQASTQVTAPPTQGANHFAIAINAMEFLVSLAQSRSVMTNVQGIPTPQPVQEYFLTLSISPSAAKTLAQFLEMSIETYEEKFGKIPSDPNMKLARNVTKP